MKRSELTNKQKLFVPGPICAAAIGEPGKLYSGLVGAMSHMRSGNIRLSKPLAHEALHAVPRALKRS